MPAIAPSRVAAYLAMAAVLTLVGWHSIKSEDPESSRLPGGPDAGRTDPGKADAGPQAGGGLDFAAGSRKIVVDVSGAVNRPGVYRFKHGLRVIDAIRRAGGASKDAFASGINRAALLSDGQQVVVPLRAGSTAPGADGAATAAPDAAGASADAPISLGSATQAELEEIEGIGPVTATAIIEFRDSQGGVSSIDELDQVTGIGPVTMEALKSRLQP